MEWLKDWAMALPQAKPFDTVAVGLKNQVIGLRMFFLHP